MRSEVPADGLCVRDRRGEVATGLQKPVDGYSVVRTLFEQGGRSRPRPGHRAAMTQTDLRADDAQVMNSAQLRHRTFRRPLEHAASRFFRDRGVPTIRSRPYIPLQPSRRAAAAAAEDPIPSASWHVNMLDAEVISAIEGWRCATEELQGNVALHGFLHHGLSSQAMAFNLVGHLLARDDVDALEGAFAAVGVPWPGPGATATLEYEDRAVFHEKQNQPTSIDLVIRPKSGASNPSIFVEVKLVEEGFGGCSQVQSRQGRPAVCSGDNPLRALGGCASVCPLSRIGRTYWQRLEEQGVLTEAHRAASRCPMADDYQFFRELGFALHRGGHFVLLVDARNPAFVAQPDDPARAGARDRLTKDLPAAIRANVRLVTVQDAVEAIRATGRHRDWIERFAAKYALDDTIASGGDKMAADTTADTTVSPVGGGFTPAVLSPIRAYLDTASLRLPSKVDWRLVADDDGVSVVEVAMSHAQLDENLQGNEAAAPTFALCLAYWLEQSRGQPVRARLRLVDAPPADARACNTWLHGRRSLLVLDAYRRALGDRFSVVGPGAVLSWQWPEEPILNAATGARARQASAHKAVDSEHHLEVAFANDPAIRRTFSELVEPIEPIERQLPVGLFAGRVAKATSWLPHGSSQVDAWAVSADGQTLHLFELKVASNVTLGILPEALSYAWLLHWATEAPPAGPRICGTGAAFERIAKAKRVIVWLTAPRLHPLLGPGPGGASPLDRLNHGLAASGVGIAVLPIAFGADDGVTLGTPRWHGVSL